jgi:UDP-N-acetylmuramoyl-L-alanine---L-glutamate ligase
MQVQQLKNKKIAIVWFGKEGKSSLSFLQKIGCSDITILDKNPLPEIDVPSFSGEKYLERISDFEVILKTPGISPFEPKLFPERRKMISQTEIFFQNYEGKVIAITGTKGKSTVSTLLYKVLKESGYHTKLVGNIGKPVLDEIDIWSKKNYDFVVYEMSSYMLQDFIPQTYISIFNNIYTCHIDWHRDWKTYKEAKCNILEDAEYSLINSEFKQDEDIQNIGGNQIYFGNTGAFSYKDGWFYQEDEKFLEDKDILLQGEHNRKNICAVLTAASIILQDEQKLRIVTQKVLSGFSGLPYRIQDTGTYRGITFINDAIATTPESTIEAIKTFSPRLETLLLGGQDSGFQFEKLRTNILNSEIQNIVLFPDTGEKIFPESMQGEYEKEYKIEIKGKSYNILKTRSMQTAVDFAYKHTLKWNIALLSCAAPSFSLWSSYIVKWDEFTKYVQEETLL